MVAVSVHNPGAIIPPEDLRRIFDRFYRGERSRQSLSDHAGLGLAIAKSIAELHEGSIEAKSEQGGTTFTFFIAAMR
jgi:signal transduction histidine kinase